MEQSNLLKLAKQGEPTAIAALMNAVLEPRGIKAQASFEADVLCVCLESPKPLNQETLVTFIRKGLLELENESIQRVRAQGKRIGEKDFAWSKEFLVHPAKRVEAPPVQPEVNEVVANEVPTVEENLPAISTAPNSEATVTGVVPEETHSEIESIAPLSHAISESEVESVSETPENPPEIDLSLDPVALPPEEASEDDLTEEDDESEEDDPLEPQSLRAWLKLYWRAYSLPVLLVIVGGFIAGGSATAA